MEENSKFETSNIVNQETRKSECRIPGARISGKNRRKSLSLIF